MGLVTEVFRKRLDNHRWPQMKTFLTVLPERYLRHRCIFLPFEQFSKTHSHPN